MLVGRKDDKQHSEAISQKVCGMLEQEMLPIDFVSKEGFLELMELIEPNYISRRIAR